MRYGAVIVAAGRSARVKRIRQLANISEMNVAERVVMNFRSAGVTDIVMVTGSRSEEYEKALKEFGVSFVRNGKAEPEMFESAKLGLESIRSQCGRIFFCPVDIPFFTDETVAEEIRMMETDSDVKVVIPSCGGRGGHPILIDGSILPAILSYKGDRGMKGAYDSLPEGSLGWITVDDEGTVLKKETMGDCRKLVDLHNRRILHPVVRVTFESTSKFFGPGTVELLREIDRCGNVREACESCGFSYSKGWTILKRCEEKLGCTIVERQAGGQTGGSAKVTRKGHDLLAAYEKLEAELSEIAEVRFQELMEEYHITE